jgi:hypothetical protein
MAKCLLNGEKAARKKLTLWVSPQKHAEIKKATEAGRPR